MLLLLFGVQKSFAVASLTVWAKVRFLLRDRSHEPRCRLRPPDLEDFPANSSACFGQSVQEKSQVGQSGSSPNRRVPFDFWKANL